MREDTPVKATYMTVSESFVYAQLSVRGEKTDQIGTPFTVKIRREFDRWLTQHDEEIVARTLLALAKPLHVELTAALDNNSTGYVFEDYPGGGWRTWISDAKQLIEGKTNE